MAEDLTDASDEDLVRETLAGRVRCYEQLDRRYRGRLIHLLLSRMASEADAEDAAQQALWQAYQKLEQFDPRRRFKPWLYAIALRCSVDQHRAKQRQLRADQNESSFDAQHDAKPGPLTCVIAKEDQANLWGIAERELSADQWTALWLHYGESLDPVEVAAAMNASRVRTRVLLHRARQRLKQFIETQTPTMAPVVACK
jgi:RNA polymerase sigma-70 factor (ECF subfamily)